MGISALGGPVLHRLSCSKEMVQNGPKHESGVQQIGLGVLIAKKLHSHFVNEGWAFNALCGTVLHRFSCSNEMVRSAPKHESRVQRSGLGAFIAKKLRSHFVNEGWAFNALCGPLLHCFL